MKRTHTVNMTMTSVLVMMMVTMCHVTRSEYLLMLDQTSCYQCNDPDGCHDDVVGSAQVTDGVNWTLDRLDTLNIMDRGSIGQ